MLLLGGRAPTWRPRGGHPRPVISKAPGYLPPEGLLLILLLSQRPFLLRWVSTHAPSCLVLTLLPSIPAVEVCAYAGIVCFMSVLTPHQSEEALRAGPARLP